MLKRNKKYASKENTSNTNKKNACKKTKIKSDKWDIYVADKVRQVGRKALLALRCYDTQMGVIGELTNTVLYSAFRSD